MAHLLANKCKLYFILCLSRPRRQQSLLPRVSDGAVVFRQCLLYHHMWEFSNLFTTTVRNNKEASFSINSEQ